MPRCCLRDCAASASSLFVCCVSQSVQWLSQSRQRRFSKPTLHLSRLSAVRCVLAVCLLCACCACCVLSFDPSPGPARVLHSTGVCVSCCDVVCEQNKAYFLNLGPHYKREGWEGIMAAAWIASAGILIVGLGYGPETGIKVKNKP